MFQKMISKIENCNVYKRAAQAAVFSAVTAASAAMATAPSLVPADVDFAAVASTILGWVSVAALAALTLFGAVQGLKIGIRTFRSIANTATA